MKSILLISAGTYAHKESVSNAFGANNYMPLALLYLSGSLSREFNVTILDLNTIGLWDCDESQAAALVAAEVEKALEKSQAFFVGINCLFSAQIEQVVKIAALVKAKDSTIRVATGGIHPTIFSEEILRECPNIDYVLKGEGEEDALELCRAVASGTEVKHIDGLTWRGPDGRIVNHPKTCFIQDPDTIPRPAYHLFDFDKYVLDTSRWHNPKGLKIGIPIPLITSRSCPQHCNFCVMSLAMGPKFRPRSAVHVLDEMEFLYHEHGTRYFEIMDDNFSLHKKRTLEICRGVVKRGLDIQIRTIGGLAINSLDAEVIEALAEAGLVWTPISIESASDFIRNKIMGKNLSLKKVFEVVGILKQYPQIIVTAVFIMGMPEDTKETLMETYDLIQKLDVDNVGVCTATPFPGTALYRQCLEEDLLLDKEVGSWRNTTLFVTNKAHRFFIKPKNISLDELHKFRSLFNEQRLAQMSVKYKKISRTAWEA